MKTMQSIDSAYINNMTTNTQEQMCDARDAKVYWVAKLADGNVWMTQNLDLDLSTETPLTSDTSDVASSWTPQHNTESTVVTSSSTNTDTYSWSLGDYKYDGSKNSSCGTSAESFADCTNYGFATAVSPSDPSAIGDESMHRHVGNHYQWNTATAGTGGTITSTEASSSICPSGWRLPIGGSTSKATNDFNNLAKASGGPGTSTVQNWLNSPYYFVRSGYVNSGTLRDAGGRGYWWSSTASSGTSYAYDLYLVDTSGVGPDYYNYRYYGFTVRCVAR